MVTFVMGIHVIVCLVLIFVVLLQAGRGGGFSDMVGGGQPQTLFGTQTNEFMVRATEVCAVLFIVTSLTLGLLTAQKGKSLVSGAKVETPAAVTTTTTTTPKAATSTPVPAPVEANAK